MTASRTLGELERTRANLLQVGTVAEADYGTARVRVLIGGLTSAWLPWLTGRAGGDRSWAAPEVGEQVLVACPDGDPVSGVVVGAIYQQDYAAPADNADVHRTTYSDGAVIEYDRGAHALTATLPSGATASLSASGGVTVAADGGVTITAATGGVSITGTLTVSGLILAQSGISTGAGDGGGGGPITIDGDLIIDGTVHVTEDVTAGDDSISLVTHDHTTSVGPPV